MNSDNQVTHSNDVTNKLFRQKMPVVRGVYISAQGSAFDNQSQTNDAFSEKWDAFEQQQDDQETWKLAQFQWYLKLYGFPNEQELILFLSKKKFILDAGCGLGYKAAWFARMNPNAVVIAMDYSDAIFLAYERYCEISNIIFVKGDIARTPFNGNVFDFINCDQVLHHTENPPETLAEFNRISAVDGVLNTYVYSKKGLPRELLDEYFRSYTKSLSSDQIWALSEQLTRLGKTLSELEITIDVPDIPLLNIIGGKQDLQRFIYWNFIKCFWNEEHGLDSSIAVNFDWYSPSNAFRYTQDEFKKMLKLAGFKAEYFHTEEACHSGRFNKQ
jgi:ubiquinone/menaquinone biosynthesis C-methylase UbiE